MHKKTFYFSKKLSALAIVILLVGGAYSTYNIFFTVHINQSKLLAAADQSDAAIDIWWPTNNSVIQGTTSFKAKLTNQEVGTYKMYWSVDNGTEVEMTDSPTDYPHKEATVDVSGWNWHGDGPYKVTFTARNLDASLLTQKTIDISTSNLTVDSSLKNTSDQSSEIVYSSSTIATSSTDSPISISAPNISIISSQPSDMNLWWPTNKATLKGVQPFKASVLGKNIESYKLFWSVDNGVKNEMPNAYNEAPHKEATVDVSGWNWNQSGIYELTFTEEDLSGNSVSEKKILISVPYSGVVSSNTISSSTPQDVNPYKAPTPVSPSNIVTTLSTAVQKSTPTTLLSNEFYVDQTSNAASEANEWKASRPADSKTISLIANQPQAEWFGDWSGDIKNAVQNYISKSSQAGKTGILVAYNIPHRDCGSYSAGGASADQYLNWIQSFANGIGNSKAIVVLEPDAVAGMDCLSSLNQSTRLSLISSAVDILKKNGHTHVYIDAGNSHWKSADDMATRLQSAGIAKADGFSLNVSNFYTTDENITFGNELSSKLNGKHYIIDTSRNGKGSNGEWCNPQGMAVGKLPTTSTGNPLIDAFLWLKKPGESDGSCNGGPTAGAWWPEYALKLAHNAGY